jgi:polyhydroxyalkanoate synthase
MTETASRVLHADVPDGARVALLARRGAWPAARRPVLFVPGYGQNRATWKVGEFSLPRWLAERGHPTYVLEHRGTGLARAWGKRPAASLDELLADVRAAADRVFDDLGDRRVALVGHSLGGLVSLLYAAERPERVAGLATLAGGFFLARGPRTLRALALAAEALAWTGLPRRFASTALPLGAVGAGLLALRRLLDDPRVPFPWPVWQPRSYAPDELRERFTTGMDRTSVGVTTAVRRAFAFDGLVVPSGTSADDVLQRVRCPVLLVHSATDALVPPAVGEPLTKRLPNAPSVRLLVVGAPPEPPLGHCDLVVSARAERQVWPPLGEWLGALS